jgi:EAL domain-containing protein (putative c-di-GMP-specific phosphodiesterase class I)
MTERIQAALRSEEPSIVYQPVFRLSDMTMVAAEALARFGGEPARSPDKWFAEAGEVGLKTQLELKAIRGALANYRSLWRRGPIYLGINTSAQTMTKGITEVLDGFPAERIVIEITEHDRVENYDELLRALAPLRARGVKIAIDDAGSGYASIRHILNLRPDFIKLDTSLTQGIDADGMRRALAKALIQYGREADCKIVAEGLETEAELNTLRDLGVHAAQGWLLGRPRSIEDLWRVVIPNGVKRPADWHPKKLAGSGH